MSHYSGGTPRRRTCFWTSPSCPWMLGTSRSRSLRSPKYVVDCRDRRAPPAPPLDSTAVLLPPASSTLSVRTSKELGTCRCRCRAPPAPSVSTLPCSPSPLPPRSLSFFPSLFGDVAKDWEWLRTPPTESFGAAACWWPRHASQ